MHIQQARTYKIENIQPPAQNFYAALMQTGQNWSRYWGDDGAYQKGANIWGARFTDNGDGTVTDTLTGLMWVRDPWSLFSWQMSWYDAVNNCENLDYAGYQDWRLPNVIELESLINYAYCYLCIDQMWFWNIQQNWYWSSTVYAPYDYYIWMVYFGDGQRSYADRDMTYNYIIPVRGGQ
jgi:hypothetical protein